MASGQTLNRETKPSSQESLRWIYIVAEALAPLTQIVKSPVLISAKTHCFPGEKKNNPDTQNNTKGKIPSWPHVMACKAQKDRKTEHPPHCTATWGQQTQFYTTHALMGEPEPPFLSSRPHWELSFFNLLS